MKKILVVDDEEMVRESLVIGFSRQGYDCVEAANGEEALRIFDSDPEITVGFVDIRMPGKSGLDIISEIRDNPTRKIEIVVMTGHGGIDEAVRALRLGAFDFLQKPFTPDQAVRVLKKCESRIRERDEQERIRQELKKSVEIKTERIQSLIRQVDSARIDTVEALVAAAGQRNQDMGSHNRRVAEYSTLLAKKLGWSEGKAERLGLWAMLHDVGIIGVPDGIRLKPGPLTQEEYSIVRAHTTIGYQIITRSGGEAMQNAAEFALTHHENWDGSGYPQGLTGDDIPIGGRIIGLCDIYDALLSPRPFRAAKSHEEAVRVIVEGDGRTSPTHFDPHILEVFKNAACEFADMFENFPGLPNSNQDA